MNASIIKSLLRIRASYYFLPAVMGLGAIVLAIVTTFVDLRFQSEIQDMLGWFFDSTVVSARSVLTTIAGSMITVAAVTFSLTMVSVTSAAGQYGPRLISNFMRDRANQITLGMFLATFLYCMGVLKSVSEETTLETDSVVGLTPNLSVLVALLLTLISVGVLIFFVHHIPETLNVGNITGKVSRSLTQQIERGRYPAGDDLDLSHSDQIEQVFGDDDMPTVRSKASGYIEAVSLKGLLKWAVKSDCQIHLIKSPGDFVLAGDPLAEIRFRDPLSKAGLDDFEGTTVPAILSLIATGQERTSHQNILFLADELVEIAARALSPGINDPFTAINCMHWYGDICLAMCQAQDAPDCIIDSDGNPRIWAHSTSFSQLCETLFGKSRQYICEDENAAQEMLAVLRHLKKRAPVSSHTVIDHEMSRLISAIKESGLGAQQKQRLIG